MMQKVHFRLTSVAQQRCYLSSLLLHQPPNELFHCDVRVSLPQILGTLSNDDDYGSENVAKKLICVLSNLIASVWTRSKFQMQATFPGVEFLRILFKFKKRK